MVVKSVANRIEIFVACENIAFIQGRLYAHPTKFITYSAGKIHFLV